MGVLGREGLVLREHCGSQTTKDGCSYFGSRTVVVSGCD